MTDVTEDRDQDGAELSAADEQPPDGPRTRFGNQTSDSADLLGGL